MLEFICLFLPAFVSVFLFEKIVKEPLCARRFVYLYALSNLSVNGVCLLVKWLAFGEGQTLLVYAEDMYIISALKYLALSLTSAVIIAVVFSFVYKKLEISLEKKK